MSRPRSPLEVLSRHQFPEHDGSGCSEMDGWGLAVCDKSDNEQMAEHQLEKLQEAGFKVVRA